MAREFLNKELYERFHSNFIKNVEEIPDNCPVFLSGGIDSATILFAMIELGRKPLCISFNHGTETEDNVIGSKMAKHFGLQYEIVKIRSDYDFILDKTKRILSSIPKTSKFKTTVQVGIPLIEMVRFAISNGYWYGAFGWGAGPLTGNGKNAKMAYLRGEFNSFRKKHYLAEHSEENIQNYILKPMYDFKMYDPYVNENLEWIMDLDWDEVHKPFQKSVIVGYYADIWENFKLRVNKSLQVVGGTRTIMDDFFLNCPKLNKNGYKHIIGVLNRLHEEVNKK